MKVTQLTLPVMALALVACNSAAPTPNTPAVEVEQQQSSIMDQAEEQVLVDTMVSSNSLTFEGKSSIVDHPGGFNDFTVNITLPETEQFADATVEVAIDMNSIYSDSNGLTNHLKEDDFFDVENYPEATYVSTIINQSGTGNEYIVTGDLTIKGVTAEVTGTATYIDGAMVLSVDVPRATFGVGNDSYGEKLLAEMIPITLTYNMNNM